MSELLRLSRWWDRQLEGGLPDSRLKGAEREKTMRTWGRISMERVFCANCGANGGLVTPNCPHIFYVCDTCVGVAGEPPGCIRVGD